MWAQISRNRGKRGRREIPLSSIKCPFIARSCEINDTLDLMIFLKSDLSALGGDLSHPEWLKFRNRLRL